MKSHGLMLTILLACFLSLGLLTGCEDNDPAEDLGENIEELGDNIQEATDDTRREIEDIAD